MSARRLDRRGALAAGAAGAGGLLLAGCGETLPSVTSPAAVQRVREGLPGGELATMRQTLVVEHAQLALYEALGPDGAGVVDPPRWARIEREHIAALEAAIRRMGGTPPAVRTTTPPGGREALLARAAAVEETAGAMWTWFAQRATAFDVRTATLSIMGAELRQLNGLRDALGRPVSAAAPVPVPVHDAVLRVRDVARAA